MNDLSNLKFTTEEGKEYAIVNSVVIEDVNYALVVNINDELDCKFVKINFGSGEQSFDVIDDVEIIEKIVASSQENRD